MFLILLPHPRRPHAVRLALADAARHRYTPSGPELDLLTHYVLGHLSLEEANRRLQAQAGRPGLPD